jgi:hypothetical protein
VEKIEEKRKPFIRLSAFKKVDLQAFFLDPDNKGKGQSRRSFHRYEIST